MLDGWLFGKSVLNFVTRGLSFLIVTWAAAAPLTIRCFSAVESVTSNMQSLDDLSLAHWPEPPRCVQGGFALRIEPPPPMQNILCKTQKVQPPPRLGPWPAPGPREV